MSEVISFRLNRQNLREARALSIIDKKRGEGMSVREILTQALINLDELSEPKSPLEPVMLEETLRKINRLLDREDKQYHTQKTQPPDNSSLREEFIVSVQNTAKPGLRASDLIEEKKTGIE